jgi:hypothetical protein
MFQSRSKNSLRQGEQFNIMRKMYRENIKHIGKNKYVGIREGVTTKDMSQYEDEFEITLKEYEVEYQKQLKAGGGDAAGYYGKTITYGGDVYYVTKRGVLRKLMGSGVGKTPEQKIDDHLCPSQEETDELLSDDFNKLKIGEPLKCDDDTTNPECQKCRDPHNNKAMFIRSTNPAGDLYWINDFGKKQKFDRGVMEDKTDWTCPKKKTTLRLSQKQINLIPMNPRYKLSVDSACTGFTINTGEKSVVFLNNKLIGLAIAMKNEVDKLSEKSSGIDGESANAKRSLDSIIQNLKTKRDTVEKLKKEIQSLNGNIKDNTHLVKSLNLRYMAWFLSLVTLILLGMYKIK